jgi:hypothetical protein
MGVEMTAARIRLAGLLFVAVSINVERIVISYESCSSRSSAERADSPECPA